MRSRFQLRKIGAGCGGVTDVGEVQRHRSTRVARDWPASLQAVIELFDGSRTRDEICAEFLARYRRPLPKESLEQLLQKLDDALNRCLAMGAHRAVAIESPAGGASRGSGETPSGTAAMSTVNSP